MREEGWKTFGLELNDETAAYARNVLGLDITTGNFVDAHFENQSFDVITIWHVLEHFLAPIVTINECNRILKVGGALIIAVPNADSLQAKISGRHWFHLDIPYHIYHFNVGNLCSLLEKSSFKVDKIRHFSFEFNPFGYLQSFLNMTRIEYNFLYNLLKTKSIRKSLFSRTRRYKFIIHLSLTVILTPFFIPLSLILAVIEAAMGRGGTIEVYATKEDVN
jgi:SAM-dependent methyltransferase